MAALNETVEGLVPNDTHVFIPREVLALARGI